MKHSAVFLLMTLMPSMLAAGENGNSIVALDSMALKLGGRKMEIPMELKNIRSVKAYEIVLKFDGEIEKAEFEPSDFLFEPLVIGPQVDRTNSIIVLSVAATQKRVTTATEGMIGKLILEGTNGVARITVAELLLIDKDKRLDVIVFEKDYLQCSKIEYSENRRKEGVRARRFQSYPNPANPASIFKVSFDREGLASLKIFNVNGQLVKTVMNERVAPEQYTIPWNGTDDNGRPLSAGVYFCRLESGYYSETRKIVLVR